MEATRIWSLGWEDPLEKEMATHSSILAWRIPWAEQHGGLQSSREGIGQELATKQQKHLKTQWRQKNSLCASHLQQHPQSSARAENCYPDFTDEETRNFETWSEWAPESQQQMAKPIESQGFLTPNSAVSQGTTQSYSSICHGPTKILLQNRSLSQDASPKSSLLWQN